MAKAIRYPAEMLQHAIRRRITQIFSRQISERHDTRPANAFNAVNLFEAEWIGAIPGLPDCGRLRLYEDPRIDYFASRIGGFVGKRVIELGPLEASHTYMISRLGAADIVAIESNKRAFLRCLVVQNALRLRNAQFLLGDFLAYLSAPETRADVIIVSGVLYHMARPLDLIEAMARCSNTICVWTHYYDPKRHQRQFSEHPTFADFHGVRLEMRCQTYDNQHLRSSSGGLAATSTWLTRKSLISAFEALGFVVHVGADERDHPAGAALLFTATRL